MEDWIASTTTNRSLSYRQRLAYTAFLSRRMTSPWVHSGLRWWSRETWLMPPVPLAPIPRVQAMADVSSEANASAIQDSLGRTALLNCHHSSAQHAPQRCRMALFPVLNFLPPSVQVPTWAWNSLRTRALADPASAPCTAKGEGMSGKIRAEFAVQGLCQPKMLWGSSPPEDSTATMRAASGRSRQKGPPQLRWLLTTSAPRAIMTRSESRSVETGDAHAGAIFPGALSREASHQG
mmetsp:Transcript_19087/g.38922  ORF Transcript_19087/g.38922 Transcript_19087/m.38922 type:complete len:236 (-) Transcript_19087:819-1526(-)